MSHPARALLAWQLLAIAVPAGAQQPTRRFDGIWDVVLTCPSEGAAAGYTFRFYARIADGTLHAQYGIASNPASLALDGSLADDGTALLNANGRTGSVEHNVAKFKSASPGTAYSYGVQAKFTDRQGSGSRIDGIRTCNYGFTKR
jgi:hypothetical protein